MNEAIGPAQVDEGAEIRDARDRAHDVLALGQLFHNALTLDLLPGSARLALRQDQSAAVAIDLDDFESYFVPYHLGQALTAFFSLEASGHAHCVRSGDEAADSAERHEKPATIEARYRAFVELALFHHPLGLTPILPHQGLVDGEDETPFIVLGLSHRHRDFVSRLDACAGFLIQAV